MRFETALPNSPPFTDRSAQNGFAGGRLDRQSEHRPPDCVAVARADPAARIYLLHNDRVLLADGIDPRLTLSQAAAYEMVSDSLVFLGVNEAGPVLAGTSGIDEAAFDALTESGVESLGLRSLAGSGRFGDETVGELAYARSLLDWHLGNRYCARCGKATLMAGGGVRRECPACGRQHFPRVDPVAIMLIIDGEHCLLGRGHHFQPGMYSCLAGFVEPGETFEAAVRRETFEEAGIICDEIRYHSSQPWPFVSSLMMGAHAQARSTAINADKNELDDVRWFHRSEAQKMADDSHPDGLRLPQSYAIARQIINSFLAGERI